MNPGGRHDHRNHQTQLANGILTWTPVYQACKKSGPACKWRKIELTPSFCIKNRRADAWNRPPGWFTTQIQEDNSRNHVIHASGHPRHANRKMWSSPPTPNENSIWKCVSWSKNDGQNDGNSLSVSRISKTVWNHAFSETFSCPKVLFSRFSRSAEVLDKKNRNIKVTEGHIVFPRKTDSRYFDVSSHCHEI